MARRGERAKVHRRLGYGTFSEYLGVVFGYKAREARERLMVARRLAELPQVAEGLRAGELVWSAARELCRVVTPDTETAWLEAVRDKAVRAIEKMVSGLEPGDLPGETKRPELERHVLHFEVGGDTFAVVREAMKKMQAEHGGTLSEEEALAAVGRAALVGPKDAGRASYQIAITLCEECGVATQEGNGEPTVVSEAVAEMVCCDGQHIGSVDVTHVGHLEKATQTVPPAKRRLVMRRDHGQCVVEGCRNATFVDVHHLTWRSDGGKHDLDGMCVLCGAHHKAAHLGTLRIEGAPSTGLRFFHADGTPYGSRRVDAHKAEHDQDIFLELRGYGLRAGDAWRALAQQPDRERGFGARSVSGYPSRRHPRPRPPFTGRRADSAAARTATHAPSTYSPAAMPRKPRGERSSELHWVDPPTAKLAAARNPHAHGGQESPGIGGA